jgi:hypothetical protein
MNDTRPETCRNRLQDERKLHPKSGCDVDGCSPLSRGGPLCCRNVGDQPVTVAIPRNVLIELKEAGGIAAQDLQDAIASQYETVPDEGTTLRRRHDHQMGAVDRLTAAIAELNAVTGAGQ